MWGDSLLGRVSFSTYEELFILQEHLYDIPEDIVNEEKEYSVSPLGDGVRVFHLRSDTKLIAAPIGAGYFTIPLRLSIRIICVSIASRSLEVD